MKLSVSILSAIDRIQCIEKLNQTNIDYFHIDVMDGIFVNNYQLPIEEIKELSNYTKKPLDIHLMVEDPESYIKELDNLNIEYITIHLEIKKDIKKIISQIKEKGYKVGISLKPNTDITQIIPFLSMIDLILIMSVEPGQGGQKFITSSLEKITKLKEQINETVKIEVDGGVNNTNIKELKKVRVDIIVSGSYIVNSDNYQKQIDQLLI